MPKISLAATILPLSKHFSVSNACSSNSSFSVESVNTSNKVLNVQPVSLDIWHQRLGHPSPHVLNSLLSNCNLSVSMKSRLSFCTACKLGKAHALPFSLSGSHSKHPLELIHSDLWGPSLTGHRYYIIFVDDFSRFG